MRHADPLVNHIVNRGRPRPTHPLCPRHHEMRAGSEIPYQIQQQRSTTCYSSDSFFRSSLAGPGTTGEEHDKKCKSVKVTKSKMSQRSSTNILILYPGNSSEVNLEKNSD